MTLQGRIQTPPNFDDNIKYWLEDLKYLSQLKDSDPEALLILLSEGFRDPDVEPPFKDSFKFITPLMEPNSKINLTLN